MPGAVFTQEDLAHRVIQFAKMSEALASKTKSRFRDHVDLNPLQGKLVTSNTYNDTVSMEQLVGAYQKDEPEILAKQTRRAAVDKFHKSLWNDEDWLMSEQFTDITTNKTLQGLDKAKNRKFDEFCVQTIFADVLTGESGTTTVTFANDRADQIPTGGNGLTRDKLLSVWEVFSTNDFDEEQNPVKLVLGTTQIRELLNDEYYVNRDYEKQELRSILRTGAGQLEGMDLIKYNGLPTDGSGNRRLVAYIKSGLEMYAPSYPKTSIVQDPTRVGNPYKTTAQMAMAGLRQEGKKFVELLCAEA